MANSAYLFATSDPMRWNRDDDDEGFRYFGSRWSIPVAWWFFFIPADVKLVPVPDCKEVRLRSPKDIALARFARRRPWLRQFIGEVLDDRCIDYLVASLTEWTGDDLVMNPEEILGGGIFCGIPDAYPDDADQARWFEQILSSFHDGGFDRDKFANLAKTISRVDLGDQDRASLTVTGWTYGQSEIWDRFFPLVVPLAVS